MRFVDIAIDLAAVLRASRGVASKHVALRSRQLDAYSRTSGVGRAVREKAEKVQEEAEGYVAKAKEGLNAQQQQQQQQRHRQDAEDVSSAARQRHAGEDGNGIDSSRAQAIFDNTLSSSKSNVPPTERNATAASSSAPHTNVSADDLGAPPDVDINIFHTARGSKILESVRNQREGQGNIQQDNARPSKEHPLRHWPPPRPEPEEAEAEVEESTAPETSTHTEPRIETTKVKSPEPLQRSEKDSRIETSSVAETTGVDKDTVEAAKILAQTDETPTTPAYVLRESKVPSSRMSRLWNYGGLAAGMLGGAMSESFSRALGSGSQGSVMLSGANMERLVAKLSRMRGAALKLGQMMSFQDSKMLPVPIQEVLQRVQDRADYMPAWQRDRVLVANLGTEWRELFSEFEEKPMAAASIGQVHKAILKSTGKPVAVKIQFPGVADSINSDLDNLSILLTATKLLPKGLYLNKTIDNARLELGWECDYEREAECAQRYKELLASEEDVFMVPDVHLEASGKQVLTMDFMDGVGVTRIKSFTQEQRDWIGTQILRLSLREITEFKFMQTDPNWTNFLYNDALKKLELLDFGASREYPEKFVTQYVQLLEAASRNDRDAVKTLSESLGYLTGHESKIMLDAHIQSVLTLAEPFLESAPEVYDFKDQTITERVKALIPVMLRERLAPPPEETYSLHRKLSGAFLLCARLGSKVRCREMFVKAVDKSGYMVKGQ